MTKYGILYLGPFCTEIYAQKLDARRFQLAYVPFLHPIFLHLRAQKHT